MLGDLEMGVDRTDSKLSDAMRRMRKFIRQTEGTPCRIMTLQWLIIFFGYDRNKIRMVYNYFDHHTDDSAGGCHFGLRADIGAGGLILMRNLM